LKGTPLGRVGGTIVLNPVTGSWTTLAASPPPYHHDFVRMAENNRDVMFAAVDASSRARAHLIIFSQGQQTTLGVFPAITSGYELDHDSWVVSGFSNSSGYVWRLSGNQVTTLVKTPTLEYCNEILIDRDPGAAPYIIAVAQNNMNIVTPRLFAVGRNGTVTTIYAGMGSPLEGLMGLELANLTGDYMTCGGLGPSNGNVSRVSKKGAVTILQQAIQATNGLRFNQDGTFWVLSEPYMTASVYKLSEAGAVLTIVPITGFNTDGATGIEVYGSRKLVCNQQGKTVNIRLKSHRPGDANQPYVLACSFNRRPPSGKCYQFSNGEYLYLDNSCQLFLSTVLYPMPSIFQGFQGVLDAKGVANAQVNIPANFPNLGITIFVAGVIYSPQLGVQTVTNTHWFVL